MSRKPTTFFTPSLFDMAPVAQPAMERAVTGATGPVPTNDPKVVQSFIKGRVRGQCIKKLLYFTGRTACEVGPVEIERTPHMIHIHAGGHIVYTYSTDHAVDLDKFREHFREEQAQ